MAINLDQHRDALVSAWKDVLSDKSPTDWALFAYEGQTNNLKHVSSGAGGLDELIEDLNSGKVMYGFVKISDPKTQLDKCILLNWQGEGANTLRKGLAANHLRDVERFFTGANITITARNEDEVEPQLIIDKVARAGSAYTFKTVKPETLEPSGPVGTVYQRVNPHKEINSGERDRFWRREEEEEKRRVEEELEKKRELKSKEEEDLRAREAREMEKREAEIEVRNNSIDLIKMAAEERGRVETNGGGGEVVDIVERVNQSDVLRKQRKQEAQELISQRTIDARSIFEQNTAAGQVKKVPEKPVRASILKAQAQQQPEPPKDETASDDESDQFATIKRSPKDAEKKSADIQFPTPTEAVKSEPVAQITDQQFVDEYLYGLSTPGLQAKALYDYQAVDDTEITFDPGDIITNIDQVDEGWWQGLAPNGAYGLFPANYVELLK